MAVFPAQGEWNGYGERAIDLGIHVLTFAYNSGYPSCSHLSIRYAIIWQGFGNLVVVSSLTIPHPLVDHLIRWPPCATHSSVTMINGKLLSFNCRQCSYQLNESSIFRFQTA